MNIFVTILSILIFPTLANGCTPLLKGKELDVWGSRQTVFKLETPKLTSYSIFFATGEVLRATCFNDGPFAGQYRINITRDDSAQPQVILGKEYFDVLKRRYESEKVG